MSLPDTPQRNQDHAATLQKGYVQDISWNLKSNQQLKVSYWWNQADREIQPVMGSAGIDEQKDSNHRFALEYILNHAF